MTRDEALADADREISRLIVEGRGLFYIAEAYGVPVRRLGHDGLLAMDHNYQALPDYLKGSPGVLTLDYLREALAYKIMGIWVNEKEKERATTKSNRIRAVRYMRRRTLASYGNVDYDSKRSVAMR